MKLRHLLLAGPRNLAMATLNPLERRLCNRAGEVGRGAVFIIGPPRSGTSLFYELLVTKFHFAYLSNLAHRLYRTPAAATHLGRGVIRNWTGNYASTHGHIGGWGAPCEGGWFWQRWLPECDVIDEHDLDGRSIGEMRRTIAAISHTLEAPFVSKNVDHSVQMRALNSIFPGCTFIEIQRNDADCVRSILKLRRDVSGERNPKQWLSVKPQGWEYFRDADPVKQVCAQVLLTKRSIEESAQRIDPRRRCVVQYDRLCANPEAEIQKVAAFLRDRGLMIDQHRDVPKTFESSSGISFDVREDERIIHTMDEVEHALNCGRAA